LESEPHQTPQSTEKPALRTRPVEPKTVRRGLLHRLQQVVNPEERAGSKSGEYKSRTERVGMKTTAITAYGLSGGVPFTTLHGMESPAWRVGAG